MTQSEIDKRLIELYAQMAALTAPECAKVCGNPYSCCDPAYCEATLRWAKKRWKTVLPVTDHKTLPLMGPTGCTAAPHLRPVCTVHTCEINSMGCKRGPGGLKWTERYFELREQIEELECEEADQHV